MTTHQNFQCPLITHFYDSNEFEYRIYSGPNWEPETTFAQVTCHSVASDGGCNDWYIDPTPTGYASVRLFHRQQIRARATYIIRASRAGHP